MYRLKQYEKGWIVEYKKPVYGFFRTKYKWVHVTHYLGMIDQPFYYDSPEGARDGAMREIKNNITSSFYMPQYYE